MAASDTSTVANIWKRRAFNSPLQRSSSSNCNTTESALKLTRTSATNTLIRGVNNMVSNSNQSSELFAMGLKLIYQKQEQKYIRSMLQKRDCKRFADVTSQDTDRPADDPVCKCGYRLSEHTVIARDNSLLAYDKWSYKCTSKEATNAFGDIEFTGYGGKMAKYVRCDVDTEPKVLIDLFEEHWRMETPKMLISVTGGAKNFQLNPKLRDVFRRSLMKVASTTGAWIITGGTNNGVMKYVGEAVYEHQLAQGRQESVVVLGVATWGIVQNREQLIATENPGLGKYPARYHVEEPQSGYASLDPNHTHFILVDNGTNGQFGNEIALRGSLEKALSLKKLYDGEDTSISVPAVCVALQGGPGTLNTMYSAVSNNTPVVVVKGSGEAADIIARFRNRVQFDEKTDTGGERIGTIDDELSKDISSAIRQMFGEKNLENCVKWTCEILVKLDYVTVFDLDSKHTTDIDHAILTALLRLNRNEAQDQIKLALAWNRVDIAKSEIFENRKFPRDYLYDMMQQALNDDKLEFVKLFLENGCDLKEFLTAKRLTQLYNEIAGRCLLRTLLKHFRDDTEYTLSDVGYIIKQLMGGKYKPLYLQSRYAQQQQQQQQQHEIELTNNITNPVDEYFDEPARELFIYSILLMRYDMASFFWKEGTDSIASALTATKLLKAMAGSRSVEDLDDKQSLLQHATDFEERAIGVANECYCQNELRAQQLLVHELPQYGHMTCLDLAVSANDKAFIGQGFCQTLLTTIWMGKMVPETSLLKIIFCMLIPPAVLWLIFYREDTDKKTSSLRKNSKVSLVRQHSVLEERNAKEDDKADQPGLHDMFIGSSGKKPRWHVRMGLFYNTPIITFMFNVFSVLAFQAFFSYIMLMDYSESTTPGIPEIFLMFWTITLVLEEIRQIAIQEIDSFLMKVNWWINDFWNKIDLVALLLFFVALCLRFFDVTVVWGRGFYIMSLLVFYLRMMHMFGVNRQLGPKLIMIGKMTQDLMFFVAILIVFLIAYGVTSQAFMYPNETDVRSVLVGIFYKPYWQMYGEFFLDEMTDETTLLPLQSDSDDKFANSVIPLVMLITYVLFTQVLLLNLLIAMFSYTFERVQENTDLYWKFQRYELIKEYFDRPPIPPPFIIFSHVYFIIKSIGRHCCPSWFTELTTAFRMNMDEGTTTQLKFWEDLNAENFILDTQRAKYNQIEYKVNEVEENVRHISTCIDDLRDNIEHISKAVDLMVNALNCGQGMVTEQEQKYTPTTRSAPIVPTTLEEIGVATHEKSRVEKYPGSNITRFIVPENKVPWTEFFPEYKPINYTDRTVSSGPHWADKELMHLSPNQRPLLPYNEFDEICSVDRHSHSKEYDIFDALPRNPKGRTGVIGRGLLGRFGPNHAADPIVTRWLRNKSGELVNDKSTQLPVLEFVAIQRRDNNQWAIPGGMVEPGELVNKTLKAEFGEEALGQLEMSEDEKIQLSDKLDHLFKDGVEVFKGYVDDPRNTDNAWMETIAMNFHDESGEVFKSFKLKGGDDAKAARWQKISKNILLYASHQAILRKVAEMRGASF